MGIKTEIFWTDATFNGWWGCQEVSAGCDNCYARTLSERWGRAQWGDPKNTIRVATSTSNWNQPRRWNARVAAGDTNWTDEWRPPVRPGTLRRLVFAHSMSDVFEHAAQLDPLRARLFDLIEQTPYLDWLLLTKRPQNIARMVPFTWNQRPLPNVWLGTSTESQDVLDRRMYSLLQVPAVVHFVSAEPLLGALRFDRWLSGVGGSRSGLLLGRDRQHSIDWVITGGESGAHHRPMDVRWVEDIDAQCKAAGVAHFFKQHGGRTHAEGGCLLRGVEVKQFPITQAREPEKRAA